MSSERKLFAAVGLFLLILLATLSFVASTVLLRSFARLEEQHTRAGALRVAGALLADLTALENSTADWAFWDDAYQFVKKPNPEFEKVNLNLESLDNLEVNGMIFLDATGRVLRSRAYDLEEKAVAAWSPRPPYSNASRSPRMRARRTLAPALCSHGTTSCSWPRGPFSPASERGPLQARWS